MLSEGHLIDPRKDAALAPRWHTALLVALILLVFVTGSLLQGHGGVQLPSRVPAEPRSSRLVSVYLPLLLVNWGLSLYVTRLFLPRNELQELLGRGWSRPRHACVDIALAIALAVLIRVLDAWLQRVAVGPNAALSSLLPSTGAERLAWVLVASSVGFCEEVVYRGYLQRQLSAFCGSASAGIVLQALLFGLAHGEQGPAAALRVGLYGLLFGALARTRRSLLPGILCHVGLDLASGLLH